MLAAALQQQPQVVPRRASGADLGIMDVDGAPVIQECRSVRPSFSPIILVKRVAELLPSNSDM